MCNRCIKQQELFPLPTSKEALDLLNDQRLAAARVATAQGASAIASSAIGRGENKSSLIKQSLALLETISKRKNNTANGYINFLVIACADALINIDGNKITTTEHSLAIELIELADTLNIDDEAKAKIENLSLEYINNLTSRLKTK